MKLTYRDKIILAIGLSLAIILAGYFVFIKKKNAEIKENQAKLETLQTQREEIERKINATPGIQKGIKETAKRRNISSVRQKNLRKLKLI